MLNSNGGILNGTVFGAAGDDTLAGGDGADDMEINVAQVQGLTADDFVL